MILTIRVRRISKKAVTVNLTTRRIGATVIGRRRRRKRKRLIVLRDEERGVLGTGEERLLDAGAVVVAVLREGCFMSKTPSPRRDQSSSRRQPAEFVSF